MITDAAADAGGHLQDKLDVYTSSWSAGVSVAQIADNDTSTGRRQTITTGK